MKSDQDKKFALVTGANKGIGLEAVFHRLARDRGAIKINGRIYSGPETS